MAELLTDEAVEAAGAAIYVSLPDSFSVEQQNAIAGNALAAFIAHHEGERPCPDMCIGKPRRLHGNDGLCPTCNGTGKVRTNRLVKLSEVVELLRQHAESLDVRPRDLTLRTRVRSVYEAADYIERELGGKL